MSRGMAMVGRCGRVRWRRWERMWYAPSSSRKRLCARQRKRASVPKRPKDVKTPILDNTGMSSGGGHSRECLSRIAYGQWILYACLSDLYIVYQTWSPLDNWKYEILKWAIQHRIDYHLHIFVWIGMGTPNWHQIEIVSFEDLINIASNRTGWNMILSKWKN